MTHEFIVTIGHIQDERVVKHSSAYSQQIISLVNNSLCFQTHG